MVRAERRVGDQRNRALQDLAQRSGSPSAAVAAYYFVLVATAIVTLIVATKLRLLAGRPRSIVVKDLSYEARPPPRARARRRCLAPPVTCVCARLRRRR